MLPATKPARNGPPPPRWRSRHATEPARPAPGAVLYVVVTDPEYLAPLRQVLLRLQPKDLLPDGHGNLVSTVTIGAREIAP